MSTNRRGFVGTSSRFSQEVLDIDSARNSNEHDCFYTGGGFGTRVSHEHGNDEQ